LNSLWKSRKIALSEVMGFGKSMNLLIFINITNPTIFDFEILCDWYDYRESWGI